MTDELPDAVVRALQDDAVGLTAIVATVDPDGRPHTAPFGSVRALSSRRLRFGCDRGHDTFANLGRDARVAICVLAPPDVAVTIFGEASVVKQKMDALATDAVVEVAVAEVKDDMLPGAAIVSGATYAVSDQVLAFLRSYRDEVERAP